MIAEGRVAVVTGAGGGIGLGIARAAAARGMAVVVSDVSPERLAVAVANLRTGGIDASGLVADVRVVEELEALREYVLEQHGRVDLVCNNAGVGLVRPLLDCSSADWRLLLDVNLTGVVNGVRVFLPVLANQGSGHISATASLSGLVGDPDLAVYTTTKFAVVGLMESLQQEMRRDCPGVTASVLCPGPVNTDLLTTSAGALSDAGAADTGGSDDVAAYLARGMDPDEVGRIAVEGIAAGRFWLLPHAELTLGLLSERLVGMHDGILTVGDDDWTDQN